MSGKTSGKANSIFRRWKTAPWEKKEEEKPVSQNVLQNRRQSDRRKGGSKLEELGFDVKAPRAFCNDSTGKKDVFDLQDINAPTNTAIDKATAEFNRLSEELLKGASPPDKMTPITSDNGVRKRIMMSGTKSSEEGANVEVSDGCRVWIHYALYVDHGNGLRLLDSTKKHKLATTLKIGHDGLPGFYFAIKSMKPMEISEFFIQPQYGYGKFGIPKFVEGNQNLRCLIQLMDISTTSRRKSLVFMSEEERIAEMENLSLADLLDDVEKLIKAAKAKFMRELYQDACDRYKWAMELLQDFRQEIGEESLFTPEGEKIDKKSFQLYSNLALCYNRLKEYNETVKVCEAALLLVHYHEDLKPKIFYRYAVALFHLKNYDHAMDLCKRGLKCKWGHTQFNILHSSIVFASMKEEVGMESDQELYTDGEVNEDPEDEEEFDVNLNEDDFVFGFSHIKRKSKKG